MLTAKWLNVNLSWSAVQAALAIFFVITFHLSAVAALKPPITIESPHPKIPIKTAPRLQKTPCVNIQIKFDDGWAVRLKEGTLASKPAFSQATEAFLSSVPVGPAKYIPTKEMGRLAAYT